MIKEVGRRRISSDSEQTAVLQGILLIRLEQCFHVILLG